MSINNFFSKNIFVFIFVFTISCKTQENTSKYLDYIDDIEFNPTTDDKNFKTCSWFRVNQYFYEGKSLQYKGEKIELDNTFFQRYKNQNITGETGLIRINFIVNCKGETDRFRIISMDNNYKGREFNKKISSQLIAITKDLKGWIPNEKTDYYQYLIFKIVNGNLIEIMP